MRNIIVTVVFVFFSSLVFSQTEIKSNNLIDKQLDTTDVFSKIENFIIDKQSDSARFYISKFGKNEYLESLSRILNNTQSYSDFYKLATEINNRSTTDLAYFSKLNSIIPIPKIIDLDYLYVKWLFINKLRNNSKIE